MLAMHEMPTPLWDWKKGKLGRTEVAIGAGSQEVDDGLIVAVRDGIPLAVHAILSLHAQHVE